jgi:hypothetical protein
MPAWGLPSAPSAAGVAGNVLELSIFQILVEGASRGIVGDINIGPTVVVEVGGEHSKAVGAVGVGDAGSFRNIGEGAITMVVEENILAAVQAWRTAGHHHAFVQARAGFRNGSGGQVHIDVVGDEKIELAVAIVIDECTAGIPALTVGGNAGFGGDIGERAVAIVVVEDVFAEVSNEEIVRSPSLS